MTFAFAGCTLRADHGPPNEVTDDHGPIPLGFPNRFVKAPRAIYQDLFLLFVAELQQLGPQRPNGPVEPAVPSRSNMLTLQA